MSVIYHDKSPLRYELSKKEGVRPQKRKVDNEEMDDWTHNPEYIGEGSTKRVEEQRK